MATKTDLRVVLGVDGQREFSATMKKLAEEQKLIKAETKNAASALKDGGTAYEKAQVKAQGLTKQIAAQEEKVKTLKAAYERSIEQQKAFAEETDDAKQKYEAANASLQKMEEAAKKAGATEAELAERFAEQRANVNALKDAYETAQNRERACADTAVDLKTKHENASASLNNMRASLEKANKTLSEHEGKAAKARESLEKFGNKAEEVGGKLEKAGSKMTKYLTVPILAAGGAAAKAAIQYEDAFAGVVKTVEGEPEELEELSDKILDLSVAYGTSAKEIAGVAQAAGQLGIAKEDIAAFSEVMIGLGISTDVSAEDAAMARARLANITKMSSDDYERLGSTIVDLGNHFATNESQIIDMTTRLAATGEITGKTEPQMLAIATALSSVGIEAEAGGSAISKLMKKMDLAVNTYETASATFKKTGHSLRDLEMMATYDSDGFKAVAMSLGMTTKELKTMMSNAKSLEQFSEVAGVTADKFIQAYGKDSVAALGMFIEGLRDTSKTGKNSVEILQDMGLTEVRLSNAVLALSSSEKSLGDCVDAANEAWELNKALENEVAKRQETTGQALARAREQLTKTAIIMGDNFLPAIADVAGSVGELAEKFGKLDSGTQKAIATFALVVAAGGPTLRTLGSLTTGVGKVTKSASSLIKVTKEIKAGTYTGPLNKIISALVKTKGATDGVATSTTSLAGLFSAGAPLIIGLVAAAGAAAGLYAAYRKLTEGDRAVTEGVEKMLSGFGKWDETVANATDLLAGLNSEIIVSSEKSASISAEVDQLQSDITTIARNAAEERRALTDGEIQRLNDLFKKLAETSQKELELQQAYQDAAITIAQTTTDFSKDNAADLIQSAEEAKNKTLALAKEQHNNTVLLLQQAYEAEGSMSAEEYKRRKQQAQKDYDQAVKAAEDKFTRVNEIVTQGYYEQNNKGDEHLQNILALNNRITELDRECSEEKKKIYDDRNLSAEEKNAIAVGIDTKYASEKRKIQKDLGVAMEQLNEDELATWVEMSANTETYGGKITDESKKTFDNFLAIYDNLPKKGKKIFNDTLQGMIDGIKEKSPELYRAADKLTGGFISKIRQKLEVKSPSRAMKRIFGYVVDGGVLGVKENKQSLLDEADRMSEGFIKTFSAVPSKIRDNMRLSEGYVQKVRAQFLHAGAISSVMKQRFSAQRAAAFGGSTTTNTDNSSHFEALLKVENLTVRNDTDIRKLSNQIERLTRNMLTGKGQR